MLSPVGQILDRGTIPGGQALHKVRKGQTNMKALLALGAAAASAVRFVYDCLTIQP